MYMLQQRRQHSIYGAISINFDGACLLQMPKTLSVITANPTSSLVLTRGTGNDKLMAEQFPITSSTKPRMILLRMLLRPRVMRLSREEGEVGAES